MLRPARRCIQCVLAVGREQRTHACGRCDKRCNQCLLVVGRDSRSKNYCALCSQFDLSVRIRCCALCGQALLNMFVELNKEDETFLAAHGYLCSSQQGVKQCVCPGCSGLVGVSVRIRRYSSMVAAGFFFLRRVAPNCAVLDSSPVPDVMLHMASPSFRETRHGSADYRTDRMSLWLSGPVRLLYGSDFIDFLVIVMFLRNCCNHSDAAEDFLTRWRAEVGDVLRASNWGAERAWSLLKVVWNPRRHWTGYGPRMFPQFHQGEKGRWQFQGVKLMTVVARRIKMLSLMLNSPWQRVSPDNVATIHFLASLLIF